MRFVVAWMAAMWLATAAWAQGAALRPDLPSASQPARRVPTTGYTLAMNWAPEYCHARRGQRGGDPECGSGAAARGFTLHGLWPDGDGPNRWPQYCRPVALLTEAQMAPVREATPSPQLRQHEWAKHGSCVTDDPHAYFAEEARLFRSFVAPDMAGLARRRDLTAFDVQQAFADANRGLRPTMVRLNVNRRGWLEEVWLCLGLDKRPRPCAASQGGAPPSSALRIETGGGRVAPRQPAYRSYRRF